MSRFSGWVSGAFGESRLYRIAPFGLALVGVLGLLFSSALLAAGISSNQYAWAENAGWLNFNSLNNSASVQVYADHLEGYVWAENLGWIRLGSHSGGGAHTYTNDAAATYGVNHDGAGNLSGYAWSENAGWINFTAQSGGGITLDLTTGQFSGYAWSENVGWISLAGTALNAATYFVAVQTYTVTPSAGSGGTVNPSTAQTVFADTTPTFTVTPNTDYVRDNTVTGDCPAGSWNGNLYTTGAITANCSIGFSFTYNPAPINGACGSANGQTVTSAPTANLCTAGTAATVTTTSTAYAWNCAGSNGGGTDSCAATRNYIVTPSVNGGNGSISPSTAQTVAYNATPSFTVTPDQGYNAVMSGTCGGALSETTYTTAAVTASCTVMASFTANAAPVATVNAISGTPAVGQTLTGSYRYSDAEEDPESGSTTRWLRNAVNSSAGADAISGATGMTYTPGLPDRGQYLFFCVIPKASRGTSLGTEACSSGVQIAATGATLTVTTTADPGTTGGCQSNPTTDCSLRDAINTASATVADIINFASGLTGQTITLTNGPLLLNKSLTIDGSSRKITMSGNNTQPLFAITEGVIKLQHLTLTGGNATTGGGLTNSGGTVTLSNSTWSSHTATSTGGALYQTSGALILINSTFVNHASPSGASLAVAGGTVTVLNSSFAGHAAGGEIAQTGGTVTLTNTLIDNATQTCTGTIVNGGNNLDRGTGCSFGAANSNIDPRLGTLGDYGGDTLTLPLLPGSPAIDAGHAPTCSDTSTVNAQDQRGVTRPALCDIGAYESQGFQFTKGGDNQTAIIRTAFADPLQVSVASTAIPVEPVNGGIVTFTAPDSGATATLSGNPATITGGTASVTATASATTGTYTVIASTAGASDASFSLTNIDPSPAPINGACGSANGQTVTSAPTANLCTAGTASTVTTTSTAYAWNCAGSNGGSTAACSATRAEPMSPAVQLSANPGNPAIDQAITFTVIVIAPSGTPGIPTGSVVVSGGGQTCTVTLNQGSGACVLSYPSAGDMTVTAAYSGDANFPAASNQLTLSVGKIATTLALTLTPTPSAPGQPVTLTATLNPMSTPMRSASATISDNLPTGTVTFRDNGTILGTAPLTEGSATLSVTTLTPGVHSLTATYSGDDVFAASTSSVVSHIVATDIPTLSEGALLLLGLLLVSLAWSQRRRFE